MNNLKKEDSVYRKDTEEGTRLVSLDKKRGIFIPNDLAILYLHRGEDLLESFGTARWHTSPVQLTNALDWLQFNTQFSSRESVH